MGFLSSNAGLLTKPSSGIMRLKRACLHLCSPKTWEMSSSGSVPSDQIVASSMSTFPPLELKLAVHSEARRPQEVVANQALMPGSNICGGRLAQSITPRSCHWHRVSSLSNTLAHPCLAPKCSKCCYFPPAVYQCKMMLPYLLSYPSKQNPNKSL